MCVCMYVCVYVCVHMCVCMNACVCVCVHERTGEAEKVLLEKVACPVFLVYPVMPYTHVQIFSYTHNV
jgi:hypothetical protein